MMKRSTLAPFALQAPAPAKPLWTIMDARRRELFAERYVVAKDGKYRVEREAFIAPQDMWLADLCAHECVTGPALGRLLRRLPPGIETTPAETWQPLAEAVGRVAWRAHRAGQRDDIWRLAPNYYRASAAEEKNPI